MLPGSCYYVEVTMEITTTRYKRCDLVKVMGHVDSNTAPTLANLLDSIIEEERFNIIINLDEVKFISSAGLRVLINTQKTCQKWGRGEVVLVNVSPNVQNSLELAGFVPLFKFFDSDTDAVGYF